MRASMLVAAFLMATSVAHAGGLDVHVLLSGEVAPGLYGQVNIGNETPPPLVYARPMLIEAQPAPPPAIYLHVPPDHARNWRRHCHEYNACNRPVYFVRSQEYEPEYQRHYRDHEHERELARQRWQEHVRDHDHDHDGGHGRGHEEHGHDQGNEGHEHRNN
jgi:hypothetical protein